MAIKIIIADDHLLFRQIVREIVEREPDLEVVAEASDGEEVALLAAEMRPDVVLMDLTMPICDGFQATERLLAGSPHSHVVILSASGEEEHVLRALQCGAIGYITKEVGAEGLLTAIRRAAQDELYMSGSLVTQLPAFLRTLTRESTPKTVYPRSAPGDNTKSTAALTKKKKSERNLPLTRREREVLNLIRRGQRNREIAKELGIAESTVCKHVQNIFQKLDARNRAEALFLAGV
jgi:DNA-binding NarL/FixJ family response regulator